MTEPKPQPAPTAVFDQNFANAAAAADQAMKLGGVILQPKKPKTGFGD
jgi:hypothetical protein